MSKLWDIDTAEPQWQGVLFSNKRPVTLSVTGKVLHGRSDLIEQPFVYVVEDSSGRLDLLKPSEFYELQPPTSQPNVHHHNVHHHNTGGRRHAAHNCFPMSGTALAAGLMARDAIGGAAAMVWHPLPRPGIVSGMSDVTLILRKIEQGDTAAAERLLPLVYDELKKLAATKMIGERPDHTLQATALVHEAYVRLVDAQQVQRWDSRGHFFSAAAEAMRRILIDSARRRNTRKRGGDRRRVALEGLEVAATMVSDPDLLLDIDAGLLRLAEEDPQAAELVKLRLFAGLSVTQAGEMLGMSRASAYENWVYVRSWFTLSDAATDHLPPSPPPPRPDTT